jgi:hypothetical protein
MSEVLGLLRSGWQPALAEVVNNTRNHLVISSPFMTLDGVKFVLANLHSEFREHGQLTVVTNLAPVNMIQGSTDPEAVLAFAHAHQRARIVHLSRLHAKVYVRDKLEAIVTSGNLTNGGLRHNFEYGVLISDPDLASLIQRDVLEYADVGVVVQADQLATYCRAASEAKFAYQEQQRTATKSAQRRFADTLNAANEELIRLRLAGETTNSVFTKTILYVLRKYGSMTTQELHTYVQQLHPDLCDDTIDRVIHGQRYGKKWKHAVRSAQQSLKQGGLIELYGGFWRIRDPQ